jgi:flagellar hook-length control protein FliK
MPNPLTLATSIPIAPNKPDAGQRENRDSEGATSFQDVLNQEDVPTEQGAETAETPEAEAAEETAGPDVEATQPLPSEQLVESHSSRPIQVAEGTATAPLVTDGTSNVSPTPAETREVANRQANNENKGQHPILGGDSHSHQSIPPRTTPVLSDGKNASSPSRVVHEPEIIRSDAVAIAQKAQSVRPEPKPVVEPSAKISPTTEVPHHPPVPAGVNARPQTPKRTPAVTQMQLIAAAKTQEPGEFLRTETAEGLFAARDEALLQTPRDSVPQLSSPSATVRGEIARAIAGQLAAAIQSRPGSGAIEITLNPEELGRVSIVLNGREDGLHMTIAAERPETLDLMRRHIATLTAEFQKLGYGEMSFDLGTSSDPHHQSTGSRAGSLFEPTAEEIDSRTDPVLRRTALGRGIDMRL